MGDHFDVLTNLCLDVINSKKPPNDAFHDTLKLCIENATVSSILLDVLVFSEGEIENSANKETGKANFISYVNLLMNTVLPEEILRAELDGLDVSKQDFTKQLIRVKTRVYFKQAKFNLLREESEGYSKLITELLEAENSTNKDHAKVVKTRVLALIGQFNLDPNRVTDIILECFENCPKQKRFFIALLNEINAVREYLCAILGFKYTFYQGVNKKTPYSLYVLTASLIQHEMVDMMKILAFMVPKTEGIKESHRARMMNAQERSDKASTISTAAMPINDSRSLDDSIVAPPSQTISFTTVTQVQEDEDAKLAENFTEEAVLASNQKLGLACALLESENWKQAQMLIDRLPESYAVQASPRLCRSLGKIIEKSIDEFYQTNCAKRIFNDFLAPKKQDEYEDFGRGLKPVKSWEDLGKLANIMWYLGPRIAYHAPANFKLLRLLTVFFQSRENKEFDKLEKLERTFVDVVAECILPSLTLSETNVALSEEIWKLLQILPYTWRYWMYSKWNQETSRQPEMNIMRGKIHGRTKYVLKRLSKETVKVMGRQLGKLCHIHPTTVLSYLLSQVQTFDNLIGPVVDGLKFLTSLEFDVLTYCIISQLADPTKHALKATDATISPWLQALGTLVGSLYRRYPLELNGMLDYVLNQLKCCKSFDLLLLREIIQNMSWIESGNEATKEQIEALGGGELLRQEGGGYSTSRNKRAAQRLRDSITKGDVAIGLCIAIAQQREYIVYEESDKLPLKLVGEMVDQCGDTFQQLVSFLTSYLKNEEYSKRLPPVSEFLTDYSLRIEYAMSLARPTIMPKVFVKYDINKKEARARIQNGDDGQKQKLDSLQKLPHFYSALNVVVDEFMNDFRLNITDLENRISLKLFTVFWMLGNYDIEVPTAAYERAIEVLKKQSKDDEYGKLKRGEETRIKHTETKLKEEQKRQTDHVERITKWIEIIKDSMVVENTFSEISETFLQLCVLPRALFSELDAVYCASFLFKLHQLRTPFFPTVHLIDRIFDNVLPLISGLTENEANSLSRFFEILLTNAQRWHADKDVFDKECLGFPGMVTKSPMDWQTYRKLCYKWQVRLQKTFLLVLTKEDTDYVIVRNCFILITKLTPSFPLLEPGVKLMESLAAKVRDREKGKRDDLSLKAASYFGRLKMRNVKIYKVNSDFAPVATKNKKEIVVKRVLDKSKKPAEKSPDKETSKNTEDGEPAEKKIRVEETKKTNGGNEKENVTEKRNEENGVKAVPKNPTEENKERKKRAKVELYVPKRVAEKEKGGNQTNTGRKEDEKPEEGEVRTPTPPLAKKSRISDRVKRPDDDRKSVESEKHKKPEKTEKPKEHVRERRILSDREKEKPKEKKKENGDAKRDHKTKDRDGKKKEAKEDRDIAGPAIPDSLIKGRSQSKEGRDKDKKEARNEPSDMKVRKEKEKKDRKEDQSKVSKIADPVSSNNRDRDRVRDRSSR